MTDSLALRLLLSSSAVALGALAATAAGAGTVTLPTGGSVRAGVATIGAPIGSSLTVKQTSTKAVIDWRTFSIGSGGKVNFANGQGVTLNRVTGTSSSQIFGTLTATGSVFLLNQNGVFIGKNGVVNVGGSFVASSLDVTDNAFMNGRVLTFGGASRGEVTNQGAIVATTGDVELFGAQVTNAGTIRAPDGEVGLAAGQQLVLSQGAPTGEKLTVTLGDPAASITNTGLIAAASAELRANGGNIYALAVNPGSRIEATGIAANGGNVYLTAGDGSLTARGEIDATRADGSGGFVETSGHSVDFSGLRVKAGDWLVDPVNLTVDSAAASTISANLVTTSVTLRTTATSASGPGAQSTGAGDIVVDAPISWVSANTLMLDAYHSISIDAAVTASGPGKVALITNDGGAGGDYGFGYSPGGFAGSLSFTGAPGSGQALTINGQAYTLLFTESDLLNVNNNLGGFYALAAPLSLKTFLFADAPIGSTVATPFTGVFTGLGNSLSDMTVEDTSPAPQTTPLGYSLNGLVGLFGEVAPGGTVRDLSLANVVVEGGPGMAVGGLAGEMFGTATNDISSGVVISANTGPQGQLASAGGLFGGLGGTAANVSSSAEVGGDDAFVGGVVGAMGPGSSLTDSSASGAVVVVGTTGTDQVGLGGGLVGVVYGFQKGGVNPTPATLSRDYATGAVVSGGGTDVGGLAGDITEANVTASYATGSVTQTDGGIANVQEDIAGGFVGYVGPGVSITGSYASGDVSTVAGPTGAAYQASFAGGFSGMVDQGSTVSGAYALGSVTSTGAGASSIGGFSGGVFGNASITDSYATGPLSAASGTVAGFVGVVGTNEPGVNQAGSIADDYWDEGTTGQTIGYFLLGSGAATKIVGIGGSTGLSPYAASTYANFDLANTWFILDGSTRPMSRAEWSTSITSAHQLQLMSMNLSADYTLANDIDMSETTQLSGVWNPSAGFVPVGGNNQTPFTGAFDGVGHTISNLFINDSVATPLTVFGFTAEGAAGLFGQVGPGGVVENVTLENADVTAADGLAAGALVGFLQGSVLNSRSSGFLTGGSMGAASAQPGIGGLVGGAGGSGALIANSSSSVEVSGGNAMAAGGLVGVIIVGASVQSSTASGDVSVGSGENGFPAIAGGLVGSVYGYQSGGVNPVTATVVNSSASGAVTTAGGAVAGGLAGFVSQGQVSGSWASGAVTQFASGQGGIADSAGGLVGSVGEAGSVGDHVVITTSYATGAVSQTSPGVDGGENLIGGFAGYVGPNATITASYASGSVSTVGGADSGAYTLEGGFAGDVDAGAAVSNSYSLASVTGTGNAFDLEGGFVGYLPGSVSQVYATGQVTGTGVLGGIAGELNGGSLSNSYWDVGTTGQTASVGFVPAGAPGGTNLVGVGGSTGLSPYAASSYANFDLANTWYVIDGETRPILRGEYTTSITNGHQLELMSLNLGASYTLANDIDARETTSPSGVWNPVNGFVPVGGNGEAAFSGSLDGRGHTISNLTIIDTTAVPQSAGVDNTNGVVGLFGYANGGVLQNIDLANAKVTGGDGMRVGALVGVQYNGSLINDASAGSVATGSAVNNANGSAVAAAGGLVGTTDGSIFNSNSSAAVQANSGYAGGLVGSFIGVNLENSYATGNVTAGSYSGVVANAGPLAGGLAGLVSQGPSNEPFLFNGDYATGNVTAGGGSVVGGLAAWVQIAGHVTNSYATGAVFQTGGALNGQGDTAGGFVGYIGGPITLGNDFASGAVSTLGGASGLPTYAGGFAGTVDQGIISNAYATGSVTSSRSAFAVLGGFAGLVEEGGSADRVYATGLVSGPGQLGGLVGQLGDSALTDTSGSLTNSYWDEGATGQTTGFTLSGTGSASNVTGMGGTTGVNPFAQATYAAWDFGNTWSTPSAGFYPQLYGVSHVIRITGGDTTIEYGDFPVLFYTQYGFQVGDPASLDAVSGLDGQIGGSAVSTAGFYKAGTYPVQLSNASASDPSGTYRIIYVDGQFTVTPRPVSVSLAGTVEKTYDGTLAADVAPGNVSLTGALPSDQVSLAGGFTSSYASKNAGTGVTVTASGFALTGVDASDYTVSGSASAPIGAIDPAALVLAAVGDTKTYDGTTASPDLPSAQGLVAGDSISNLSQSFDSKNAGARTLSVNAGYVISDGNGGGNYDVTVEGAAGTIDAAALVLAAVSETKTYDGTTASPDLPSAQGLVAGDSVSNLSQRFDSKNAGARTLSVNAGYMISDGNGGSNYAVTLQKATGTIDPAALVLTAVGDTKAYDGTTVSPDIPSAQGLVAGDSISNLSQSFDSKNAGARTLSVSAGYMISDGNAGGNYDVTVKSTAGAIDRKALTASLTGQVVKSFDGTTTATLAPDNYLLSGTITGDEVSLNDPATGAYDTSAVGQDKTVTVSGIVLEGADAGDYTVNGSAQGPIGVIQSVSSAVTSDVIQPQIVTVPATGGLSAPLTVGGDQSQGGTGAPSDASPDDQGFVDNSQGGAGDQELGGQAQGESAPPPAGQDVGDASSPSDLGASEAATDNGGNASAAAGSHPRQTAETVFPYAKARAGQPAAGDNAPVTGAGNGDLWPGSNAEEGGKP